MKAYYSLDTNSNLNLPKVANEAEAERVKSSIFILYFATIDQPLNARENNSPLKLNTH